MRTPLRLTFLGTGTSFGVPVIGCSCAQCTSDDPRDQRSRHAALLSWGDGRRLLVDTPPELRLQLVREGVDRLDAIWYTHMHADHVHGIDDLRIFSMRTGEAIPAFASAQTRSDLEERFAYIFDPAQRTVAGFSIPHLTLNTLLPGREVEIERERFLPIELPHGAVRVLGFRVRGLGYITDAKSLPSEAIEALRGVRVLVLNALWWGDPHPGHFNVEEAVDAARAIGAERCYLTHLTHRVGHQELLGRLPPGVQPAYDGLMIDVPE